MQNTAELRPRQTQIIRPTSGWVAVNLRELIQYRDLLLVLARRDIKLRYRQTLVGPMWIVLEPLLAAGVFTFVFGKVANMKAPEHVPYYIFSFSGLLGWNLFSGMLTRASGSLVASSHLVAKVYFPRLILPLAAVCGTLVDFGVALAVMAVLLVVNHIVPGIGLLTLPFWLALILMLGLGIGLCASALMVSYRDVNRFLGVCTTFLMWMSPVAYSTSDAVKKLPASLQFVYTLNPIAPLLEGLRWSLLGKGLINVGEIIYAALFSCGVLAAGALAFKRMEKKFADVI